MRPYLDILAQRLYDQVWACIAGQMRAFIGMTVFKELCREWLLAQIRAGWLPLAVEPVAHLGGGAKVGVVAINWRWKALLLGEAKWGTDPVGQDVVRELIADKISPILKTLPDTSERWTVHYAFFARDGFTDTACEEADSVGAQLVDLEKLDVELRNTLATP